ncbi:MAG: hypothetical protein F4121_10775 [Acidimicrobiia bacterium]|nr:hypothetical protein [Acidimicrobiia bacterium]
MRLVNNVLSRPTFGVDFRVLHRSSDLARMNLVERLQQATTVEQFQVRFGHVDAALASFLEKRPARKKRGLAEHVRVGEKRHSVHRARGRQRRDAIDRKSSRHQRW